MKWFKAFVVMIQFLTRIPIKLNIELNKEDFGKALILAPIVGVIIGGLLFATNLILQQFFPSNMTAIFLIITYILITGGLHLDGLGDTFDGVFSNRSKERMLEIMRDSRVGTNATLAVVSLLFINYATISSILPASLGSMLILMPVAGRIGSLVGAGMYSYARTGEGLGKNFVDYCGIKQIVIGFFLAVLIFYAILGVAGIYIVLVPLISALILSKFFASKIGGITGDILGAVCEINQTVFIVCFFLITNVA